MTASHGPAEHYGGSSRYIHNQLTKAKGQAQLALRATGIDTGDLAKCTRNVSSPAEETTP